MGKSDKSGGDEKTPRARKRKKYRWIKYALIAPFIGIILYVAYDGFWAMDFAKSHGCKVNEAGVYPCIVNGKDWGQILARKLGLMTMLSFMAPMVILPFLLLAVFMLKDMFVYFRSKLARKINA
ncbi:MAG: hypothetical protein ACU0CA_07720 [Paracoccaceae bacterium]